jgi:uncharacterized membrane protein YphA (DoxX/SURF4 family)
MRGRTIGFWMATGTFAALLAMSGSMYLAGAEPIYEGVVKHLGYPVYFLLILGFAKLLGAAALVLPVSPKIKEWAYAGFTFNLLGASVSHFFAGDAFEIVPPLVLLGVLAVSYRLKGSPARAKTVLVEETLAADRMTA